MAGPWRKPASDFSTPNKAAGIQWYDQDEDWTLIVASFAEQYGVRLETEDITWPEYYKLLSGLSSETALGRIVSIRSEKDKDVLKKFTPEQKRIRREWANRQQKDSEATVKYLTAMEKMFESMLAKG